MGRVWANRSHEIPTIIRFTGFKLHTTSDFTFTTTTLPSSNMYTSNHPSVKIPDSSIYSLSLPKQENPKFNPNSVAFIDAPTGKRITRRQLRELTLELAWSVKNKLGVKRGDVAMVFR